MVPFVRISETAAVVNHPDNPRGHWHSDWPFNQGLAVRIQAPYPDTLLHLGTLWSLTPFSRSTGGTWILPGSHRQPNNPTGDVALDPKGPCPGEVQVSAAAGSVIAYDSRLWHATATNRSQQPRVALAIRYAPWWLNLQGLMRETPTTRPRWLPGVFRFTFRRFHPAFSRDSPRRRSLFSPIGFALEGYQIEMPSLARSAGSTPLIHPGAETRRTAIASRQTEGNPIRFSTYEEKPHPARDFNIRYRGLRPRRRQAVPRRLSRRHLHLCSGIAVLADAFPNDSEGFHDRSDRAR